MLFHYYILPVLPVLGCIQGGAGPRGIHSVFACCVGVSEADSVSVLGKDFRSRPHLLEYRQDQSTGLQVGVAPVGVTLTPLPGEELVTTLGWLCT